MNTTRSQMRAIGSRAIGRTILGITPGINNLIGSHLLAFIAQDHPTLDLVIVEGFATRLRELLIEGSINCALTYDIDEDDFSVRTRHLAYEPTQLLAAAKVLRRWPSGQAVTLDQVAQLPLFLATASPNEGFSQTLLAVAQDRGIKLQLRRYFQSVSLIRQLLQNDELATLMPIGSMISEVLSEKIRARVVNEPRLVRSVQFAIPKNRNFLPTDKLLLELIEKLAGRLLFSSGIWRGVRESAAPVNYEEFKLQQNALTHELLATTE